MPSSTPPNQFKAPAISSSAFRTRCTLLVLTALTVLGAVAPLRALAQAGEYPQKQVRIVLGYPTGGAADAAARLLAENLRVALGQTFIVDNKPGASGNIGAQIVAAAPADGYTIFFGNSAEMAINPSVMKDMGFNPSTDFVPVVRGYMVPLVMVVPPNSRFKNVGELVVFAKQNAGKLNYASAGTGTPGHLAGESLAVRTGTKMTHVPYKGGTGPVVDVMSGQVDFYFAALASVAQQIKGGKLRALAVSAPTRSPFASDIATVSEQINLPNFDFTVWGGLFVSSKTPREVVSVLNKAANDAYRKPEVREQFAAQMSEAPPNSPEEFGNFVKNESAYYARVVKEVGYVQQ